ncbi:DUF7662 domain-containing protein [Phenylobacterium sp.]|uniref:DUF7662 domain-containing protein n=1 Tax=Phenylobacterium sp. TaxID=1871053 RepID=UPI002FD8F097
MSKYKPLTERLSLEPGVQWRASFLELEALLGAPLPKAAREQKAWWTGSGKPHHAAWTDAGWAVESVDREAGAVIFRRNGEAAVEPGAVPVPAPPPAAQALIDERETPPADLGRRLPAALVGGAAALVAGAASLLAGFLAKRRGEPWR